jgi:lipooligosaccharide transport system ATP-binding protein
VLSDHGRAARRARALPDETEDEMPGLAEIAGCSHPGQPGGTPMVEARGLVKRYRTRSGPGFTAVDGISFRLDQGECFGLLGPNGAGKSSTMRMISCVSRVTGGTLRVLGLDPERDSREIRSRIGVVPQDDALDRELTVAENFRVYGRYFGLAKDTIAGRTAALLEFAKLQDKAASPVQALSGGMRRRLTIARALINDPELLLLDEPTTGLDPQARHALWERLFRLKQQGVTLILTTHYMDEAEQLCDRIVVLDAGRIVAEGTPRALIERYCPREVVELRFGFDELTAAAGRLSELRPETTEPGEAARPRVETLPDRLLVYTGDGDTTLAEIRRLGLEPVTALVRRSTLEDVFLALTGRALVD